jgi:hypothetical protein
VLRAQVFERDAVSPEQMPADRVCVLEFEVDDISPEALASGLDAVRATPGVVDVFSYTGHGKKQRVSFAVRVLCTPEQRDQAVAACMVQTTTLGVRVRNDMRYILPRQHAEVTLDHGAVGVKIAQRPDGSLSAKAEHDDIETLSETQQDRFAHAADAVARALEQAGQSFKPELRSKTAQTDNGAEDSREP